MQLNTRLFGEIEIEEEKIIFFENGIIGFPDCTRFTLIFDLKEDGSAGVCPASHGSAAGEGGLPPLDCRGDAQAPWKSE